MFGGRRKRLARGPGGRYVERSGSEIATVILAFGMAIALNVITAALLYAAVARLGVGSETGLSDNGVQVLLAWGGGIISFLAGSVGYVTGKKVGTQQANGDEPPSDPPTGPPTGPPRDMC